MPKVRTSAGALPNSHQPYSLSSSRRRESENVPDGRTEVSRSASGVQIPQHQLSSSRPIEVQPSSNGLTRRSSLYHAYPQPTLVDPPHLCSCAGSLPTPSYPPYWNTYPDSCNDGTMEGSTALFQPPSGAPFMIDLAPQLQRPTDGSLQWGNEQAVEPWLYNAQYPLPSCMSLGAGPSSSPPSVFTPEAPSSNYSFFPGANNFQMRDVHFTIKGPSEQDQWWFHGLPKHPDMSGRQPEYLPDSRTPDVEQSLQWASSLTDLVLCIYGPAGIGKSTLAGHLSGQLRYVWARDDNQDDGSRTRQYPSSSNTEDRGSNEAVSRHLAGEPSRGVHPGTGAITQPPASARHDRHALDEWQDYPRFLKALGCLNLEIAVIKFILTSRSNPQTSRLPDIDQISMSTFALHPVSTNVMRSYFDKHLRGVPWVDGRKARSADVNKLADLSGGLPVWAWTVISLLSQPLNKSPPHEILAEILASGRQVGGSKGLSELYHNALSRLFPTAEARRYFQQYLGAVLVLQEPLSLPNFSKLAGMPPHLVNAIHSALSTIQTRSPPDSETTVHPASTRFHLSFLEYAQDNATSTTAREDAFTVSAFESHSALGLVCLETVSNLPPLVSPQVSKRPYSLHGIQHYAVKHWPLHVSHGTRRTQEEWLPTPQCSALQTMSLGALQRWAAVFLNILLPEEEEAEFEDQNATSTLTMVADSLEEDDGDHWVLEVACLEVAVRLGSDCDEAWCELGWRYDSMGDRTGNPKMYEEVIFAFRRALELRPEPHAGRSSTLGSLGSALCLLHGCNGDIGALTEGILQQRDALALCPAPHPDRFSLLNNLAYALWSLYEQNGDANALNEAILHNRDALALCPAPHPDRSALLNNLGNALRSLYEQNGDANALNEAILHNRDALALHPPPHPDRWTSLNNLANALHCLYEQNGDTNALNEAIFHNRDALALHPVPHPNRSKLLNNLVVALRSLYEQNGDTDALNEAVLHNCNALALCPVPHPDRWMPLENLGIALLSQHDRNGDVTILNEAVDLCRELLVLHPFGHWQHASHLQTLVTRLEKRFALTGDEADHEEIKALQREL